ncbi:MAG: hypothetical protein ACRDFA_03205 [bacterium]
MAAAPEARVPSQKAVGSWDAFDNLPPIIVHRETIKVIDGNHRLLAAKILLQ